MALLPGVARSLAERMKSTRRRLAFLMRDTGLLLSLSPAMTMSRARMTEPTRTLLFSSAAFSSAMSARNCAEVISLRKETFSSMSFLLSVLSESICLM